MKHLLWLNGVGAIVDLDRGATTSGDYSQLYTAMEQQSGEKHDQYDWAAIVQLDEQQCQFGVYWDWELAGPGGASYRLHILPDVSEEAAAQCVAHIRHSFDCIQMLTNRIFRLVDFQMPILRHEELR